MSNATSELEKEFELERMILFSDAVFAIAITLLVIEIKFPDVNKGATNAELLGLFKPTIISFAAFMLSFLFIGILWSKHLQIFKYVRTYNRPVIFLNLLLLFFVACFPFSASGLEHFRPSFELPFYIYCVNVALVFFSQFALCNYVFKRNKTLAKAGFEKEKEYIFQRSKFLAIELLATTCIVLIVAYLSNSNARFVAYALYSLPVMIIITRKRLKKYKSAIGNV